MAILDFFLGDLVAAFNRCPEKWGTIKGPYGLTDKHCCSLRAWRHKGLSRASELISRILFPHFEK